MSRLTVIGDVLLDRDVDGAVDRLAPDAPAPVLDERSVRSRPGGAGLAALLAAHDGHDVVLVTALAEDAAGAEVASMLRTSGVDLVDLGLSRPQAEKIRLRTGPVCLARWDRGGTSGPEHVGAWTDDAERALLEADAALVSCYGRGITSVPTVREALERAATRTPIVWDPHPRGGQPTRGTTVATPNLAELGRASGASSLGALAAVTAAGRQVRDRWEVGSVVVTMGARGALVVSGAGLPGVLPTPVIEVPDPCGAGDRFASTLAGALADGETVPSAAGHAVASASAFVAAGGATHVRVGPPASPTSPRGEVPDAVRLAERVRAEGGTVVATGGCFDLVHAGHVHLLQAARSLGDCLIVCMNGDGSVRRLKGPGRPVVREADRADLLRALASVDAVVTFEEDTPVETLRRLRPHIFAKGGDYGASRIPEADVVAAWDGQAVTLPYLEGRSTSRILEEVSRT